MTKIASNGKKMIGRNAETKRKHKLSYTWAFLHCMHGDSKTDVINGLVNRYGYSESYATSVYNKAVLHSKKRMAVEANALYDRNLNRLETMINDAIEDDDSQNALKAIQEQNKMIGANTVNSNVTLSNGEGENEFHIKIEN